MKTVELAITPIGNSRGIRIPTDVLRRYKLGSSVLMEERAGEMNAALDTFVVCPLTTMLHPGWRSRVQITSAGKRAEIAVDQIRTVSKRRIVRRLGKITAKSVAELQRTISEVYGEG